MIATDELKPCPFCGGKAMKITSPDGFTSIGCAKCNPVFVVMVVGRTEKQAVDLWNRRTYDATLGNDGLERSKNGVSERGTCHMEPSFSEPIPLPVQEFECSNCGGFCQTEGDTKPIFCPNCGAEVVE